MTKTVLPLIRERRTTRVFSEKKVSDEDVRLILEAGRWAPSSMNLQPWKFIVIKSKRAIRRLWNASYYHHEHHKGEECRCFAPVVIALVVDTAAKPSKAFLAGFEKKFSPNINYMNIAMPALNMAYQAQSLGLACGLKTPVAADATKGLRIPPGNELAIIVNVGYAAEEPAVERTRKPLKETVFYEKFGTKVRLQSPQDRTRA